MTEPYSGPDHPDMITTAKKNDLGESELTIPTDGSVSEEDGYSGWFGEFRSIAKSTKDTFLPAFDGIANLVHRSAMAVAAEIAQLEHDAELDADRWRDDNYGSAEELVTGEVMPLPWELVISTAESADGVDNEAIVQHIENEELKEQLLALSTVENTFLEPFSPDGADEDDTPFTLSEPRIQLIRRLLHMDVNLARMHAKLSGRSNVKETIFWKNYFCHCNRLRLNFIANHPDLEEADNDDTSTLGSLIGAESVASSHDDSSYVRVRSAIASAPSSLNTLPETLSVGDMVMIGADGGELDMSPMRVPRAK